MEINTFLENIEDYNFLYETPEIFEFISDKEINSPFEFLQKMSEHLGNLKFEYSDKIEGNKKFNIQNNINSIKCHDGGEIEIRDPDGNIISHITENSEEKIINSVIKDKPINNLKIIIGKDFSYLDFSKLFLELEEKYNNFVKNTEKYKRFSENEDLLNLQLIILKYSSKIKKNYENKIVSILQLFQNNYFLENTSPEVKKIWKKRINLYYTEYLKYFDKKEDGEIKINELLNGTKINKKFQDKIIKNIEIAKSEKSKGHFVDEAKELLELDLGVSFDLGDLNSYFDKIRGYIDTLNITPSDRNLLKKIIKIRKRGDKEKYEDYIKENLFNVSKELDNKINEINNKSLNNKLVISLNIKEQEDIYQLKNEINNLFENLIIEQANSSAWRLSSLPETIKEIFAKKRFEEKFGKSFEEKFGNSFEENIKNFFEQNFKKQWDNVKSSNEELNLLRKEIKKEPNNLELINKISEIELGIALILNKIIYSQKFISYGNNFSTKGLYGKGINRDVYEQNCYGQANIMNTLSKSFFNLNLKTANRNFSTHFIPILELSNGELWRLDYNVENLSKEGIKNIPEPQEYKNTSIIILPTEVNNKVGLYSHVIALKKFSIKEKIYFLEKAIKTSPNAISLYSNYINLLSLDFVENNNLNSLNKIKKLIVLGEKISLSDLITFYNIALNNLFEIIKKSKNGKEGKDEKNNKINDLIDFIFKKYENNISKNNKSKNLEDLKSRFKLIKDLKEFSKNLDVESFFEKYDDIVSTFIVEYKTFNMLEENQRNKITMKLFEKVGFKEADIKFFLNKIESGKNVVSNEIKDIIWFKYYFRDQPMESILYLIVRKNWNKYNVNKIEKLKKYFYDFKEINKDYTGYEFALFNSYGITIEKDKELIIKINNEFKNANKTLEETISKVLSELKKNNGTIQ